LILFFGLYLPAQELNRQFSAVRISILAFRQMDPDQDLLDRLDRREGGGPWAASALMGSFSLLAGLVGYFTLRLELSSSRELSIDGAALIAIAAFVGLFAAYHKYR
jgi:hypothetical protein